MFLSYYLYHWLYYWPAPYFRAVFAARKHYDCAGFKLRERRQRRRRQRRQRRRRIQYLAKGISRVYPSKPTRTDIPGLAKTKTVNRCATLWTNKLFPFILNSQSLYLFSLSLYMYIYIYIETTLPDLSWPDLTWPDLTWPYLAWPDLTWPDLYTAGAGVCCVSCICSKSFVFGGLLSRTGIGIALSTIIPDFYMFVVFFKAKISFLRAGT